MASLYTKDLLPTSSEQAIREFKEDYLAVVTAAPAPTWADRFKQSIGAPRATYPVSLMSTKFLETKEKSGRFRKMAEEAFDLKVVEFDAGFEAPIIDLTTNVFAYRNWQKGPSRLNIAEGRHVCRNLASLLEGGTSTTSPWDKVAFFSAASHMANPAFPANGTWGNYNASATDPAVIANIQAEQTAMRGVLDENGDKLGVEPTEIWLPTPKFQYVSDLLNQERLANGASNPLKGKLTPVHVPDLTDVNDWYLVDGNMIGAGLDPMLAAKYAAPDTLGLRTWDENSDWGKDNSSVKVSAHIWYGFALVFPHAIRRIAGA